MPHRDDFEAALARIAALEHELESARGDVPDENRALRAENARLVERILELERKLADALATDAETETEKEVELDRRTTELAAKLRAFTRDDRARYLVDEAERAATTQPLRAVVQVARRFIEGTATQADLDAAIHEAGDILHRAAVAVHAAQVAHSQSLDALAQAVHAGGDSTALKAALDAPNPSLPLMEDVRHANVVFNVLMAIDPEHEFLDIARVLTEV